MCEPILMLGVPYTLRNRWTTLEKSEVYHEISAMDFAEVLISGAEYLVLAAHEGTPVERLKAAVANGTPQKKQRRKKK